MKRLSQPFIVPCCRRYRRGDLNLPRPALSDLPRDGLLLGSRVGRHLSHAAPRKRRESDKLPGACWRCTRPCGHLPCAMRMQQKGQQDCAAFVARYGPDDHSGTHRTVPQLAARLPKHDADESLPRANCCNFQLGLSSRRARMEDKFEVKAI